MRKKITVIVLMMMINDRVVQSAWICEECKVKDKVPTCPLYHMDIKSSQKNHKMDEELDESDASDQSIEEIKNMRLLIDQSHGDCFHAR